MPDEKTEYKICFLIGESGSGKDFLASALCTKPSLYHKVVITTTRPMRSSETADISYHYVTESQYKTLEQEKEIYGTQEFNGWYYGVQKADLHPYKTNICVLSPKAVLRMSIDLNAANINWRSGIVWIKANDKVRIIRQLCREDNPSIEEVFRRYEADKADFSDEKIKGWMKTLIRVDNSQNDKGASALKALRSILLYNKF